MKKTAALSVMAIFLLAPFAFSQMPMGRGMMADEPLQLTSDQISKIRQMNLKYRKELIPLRMKLQEKNLELTDLMAETASQEKIDAKIEEITQVYSDFMKKSVEHRRSILGILTDEQKEMFNWNMGVGMRGVGMMRGMGMRGYGMMGRGMGMMGPGMGMGMMGFGCGLMGGMGPWNCPFCGRWHW